MIKNNTNKFKIGSAMKVLRSIISPQYLLEKITKQYNLKKELLTCSLLKACGSNDIYLLVYQKQKFIVKIYSNRQCWPYFFETYLFETKVIDYLSCNGINVSRPILNIQNSHVSIIDSPEYTKYYVLYSYIDGSSYQNSKPDYLRLFELGKNLALLHNTLKNYNYEGDFTRKVDLEFLLNKPLNRINNYAQVSQRVLSQLNTLGDNLQEDANKMYASGKAGLTFKIIPE